MFDTGRAGEGGGDGEVMVRLWDGACQWRSFFSPTHW